MLANKFRSKEASFFTINSNRTVTMYVQKATWLLHILVSFVIRTQYLGICIIQHKSWAWHVPSMADNKKYTIRIVGTLKRPPPWQAQLGRFLPTILHDNGCRSSFQIVFLFNTKWRTKSRNQAILRVKSLCLVVKHDAFLTSALETGEWWPSYSGYFTTSKKVHGKQSIKWQKGCFSNLEYMKGETKNGHLVHKKIDFHTILYHLLFSVFSYHKHLLCDSQSLDTNMDRIAWSRIHNSKDKAEKQTRWRTQTKCIQAVWV